MSSPTPSMSSNQNSFPSTAPVLSSSAALYLYTFLATLVLLLTVSAAIVIRSFVIRRRQRALIAEAIRNGTYVPPPSHSTPRPGTDLGAKPTLHDVYLLSHGESDAEKGWQNFIPLAATSLKPSPNPLSSPDVLSPTGSSAAVARATAPSGRFWFVRHPLRRSPANAHANTNTNSNANGGSTSANGNGNANSLTAPAPPSLPSSPHPGRSALSLTPPEQDKDAASVSDRAEDEQKQEEEEEEEEEEEVNVAVLIAMPSSAESAGARSDAERRGAGGGGAGGGGTGGGRGSHEDVVPHVEVGIAYVHVKGGIDRGESSLPGVVVGHS